MSKIVALLHCSLLLDTARLTVVPLVFIGLAKLLMPYIIRLQEKQDIRLIREKLHEYEFIIRMPDYLPGPKGLANIERRGYEIPVNCNPWADERYYAVVRGFLWWKTMKYSTNIKEYYFNLYEL